MPDALQLCPNDQAPFFDVCAGHARALELLGFRVRTVFFEACGRCRPSSGVDYATPRELPELLGGEPPAPARLTSAQRLPGRQRDSPASRDSFPHCHCARVRHVQGVSHAGCVDGWTGAPRLGSLRSRKPSRRIFDHVASTRQSFSRTPSTRGRSARRWCVGRMQGPPLASRIRRLRSALLGASTRRRIPFGRFVPSSGTVERTLEPGWCS